MTAKELPPARTVPLDKAARKRSRLSWAQRRLARKVLGAEALFVLARTRSRVDVGSWLGRRRVCAAALGGELALFAAGRRPYRERIPFSRLRESQYNSVTGELVLAPAEGARVRALRVSPLDAYQLLAQMHEEPPQNHTEPH